MNITKVTIESMSVERGIAAEGEGAFAVVKDGDGVRFLIGGLVGPELFAAAVSEATRALMATAGKTGRAIAAAALLEAIGDKDAAGKTADKMAANHEAALAIMGEEGAVL